MPRFIRELEVSVEVAAPAGAVWEVVADPTRVGEWSHECRQAQWLDGARAPAVPGARFGGRNAAGPWRWGRCNEVVAVDPGRELVWRTLPSWRFPDSTEWRLRVEPVDDRSARLTQSYRVLRMHPLLERVLPVVVPSHRDRSEALRGDLRRLGAVAGRAAPPPSSVGSTGDAEVP